MKYCKIVSYFVINVVFIGFMFLSTASRALGISVTGWSNTKTNDSELIFLVSKGDKITFSVTTDVTPGQYIWFVNQTTQAATGSSISWTVPNADSSWNVMVEAREPNMPVIGVDQIKFASQTWSVTTTTINYLSAGKSIQAAIDSLPPAGGIVELAAGTWELTSLALVVTPNVTIRGQGMNSTILKMTVAETPIIAIHLPMDPYKALNDFPAETPNIEHIMNFTIENLQLIGTGMGSNSRLPRAIEGINASNVTIHNVKISQFYGGILLAGSKDVSNPNNTVHIHDINIHECITEMIGAEGLYIQYATGGTIANNTLYGATVAISMNSADWGFIIRNNKITTGSIGITLYSLSNNNLISNNVVDITNAVSGIRLYAGTSGSVVENNIVFSDGIHAYREYGILINLAPSSSDGVIIRNNLLYNNKYGIWGDIQNEYSYNATLQIYNNTIFNNSKDGIYLPFQYNTFIVKNNIIINNGGYGLNITKASSIRETYNDVWNNVSGDYLGITKGDGDISSDPLFADSPLSDTHLKSSAGRWTATGWVTDTVISPCIGAGDPASDNSKSLWGGTIEMGAYGNTAEASQSGGPDINPPILNSITIVPDTVSVVKDNTQTFTAQVKDQFGNPMTVTVSWASSNSLVGTIDSDGVFTARTKGLTTVTASSGTVSGSAAVTVTYRAEEQKITVYPNPYIKGKSPSQKITFANLSTEATIRIYTGNGKLVKELSAGSDGKAEWKVSDASSGVYLYVVSSAEGTKKGKVSVVK